MGANQWYLFCHIFIESFFSFLRVSQLANQKGHSKYEGKHIERNQCFGWKQKDYATITFWHTARLNSLVNVGSNKIKKKTYIPLENYEAQLTSPLAALACKI